MARAAGQPAFSLFEIAPVGVLIAASGGLYLLLIGSRMLDRKGESEAEPSAGGFPQLQNPEPVDGVGDARLFAEPRPFAPVKAYASLAVFVGVVAVAAMGWMPIAASAFTGAVLLILMRVISAEDAYRGLRPEILLLIAGMVVVGLALELSGLAGLATDALVRVLNGLGPLVSLVLLYGVTLVLTEILSNAAVAVLITPMAVALAESLGVSPKPFLVAVMMAASAAFATPFGYQTNVLVFQMGRYSYMDFIRVGLPLNLITWAVATAAIPEFFPF
jgi:di/tricarboxylate transporter